MAVLGHRLVLLRSMRYRPGSSCPRSPASLQSRALAAPVVEQEAQEVLLVVAEAHQEVVVLLVLAPLEPEEAPVVSEEAVVDHQVEIQRRLVEVVVLLGRLDPSRCPICRRSQGFDAL